MLTRRCLLNSAPLPPSRSPPPSSPAPGHRPPIRCSRSSPASVFSATWSKPSAATAFKLSPSLAPMAMLMSSSNTCRRQSDWDAKSSSSTAGLEQSWMPRLIEASNYKGPVVVTSKGTKALRMKEEGESGRKEPARTNMGSRTWSTIRMPGRTSPMARSMWKISWPDFLRPFRPARRSYRANGQSYITEIDKLDAEVRTKLAAIPQARRKVVTTHDAFQYFGKAYGLELLAPEGVSTEAEASAEDTGQADPAIP